MTKNNFHKLFDKGTKTKLYIFNEYFKESFPVFLHSPYWKEVLIFDFFAGIGYDESGEKGTTLNILEQIKPYCKTISEKGKKIHILLNDREYQADLERNVNEYFYECKKDCVLKCIFDDSKPEISNRDFATYFDEVFYKIKDRRNSAKLIFLDPFNFILDENKFHKLINLSSTDFICFLPSSYLRRFREYGRFNTFIDTKKIDYDNTPPAHCHRVIADYFESLIPHDKEYYIGCFSIKKGSNYYGLLFGSNHTLGAEKFQKVCWDLDPVTGEADYNIDREPSYQNPVGTLFMEYNTSQKVQLFQKLLFQKILNREILTDQDAYRLALKKRCQVKHAVEVIKDLMNKKKIQPVKTYMQDIHKRKPTNINLL